MKTCSGCKETKPYEKFSKRSAAKDGRQSYCRDCSKVKHKARYQRKRKQANEWQRAYYQSNANSRREYGRRYQQENQHVGWKAFYIARCKKYGIPPHVEAFTQADLTARYGDSCFWCGGTWSDLDHVIAVRDGGPHTLENCRPSCAPCNGARGIEADRIRLENLRSST